MYSPSHYPSYVVGSFYVLPQVHLDCLLAAAGQTNLSLRLASLAVTDCSCWAVSSRPAGAGSQYIVHGPARVTAAEVGFSQVASTARLRT